MINIKQIYKSYGEKANKVEVLKGIDTEFPTKYDTFAECIFISGLNSNKLSYYL